MNNRNDIIFRKIINNERLDNAFDITPSKYPSIDMGRRALQPEVKAIAEIIHDLSNQIEQIKADMRVRNQSGTVVIDQSTLQSLYRKVVSTLSK